MIHLVKNHQPLKNQVNKSVFLPVLDDCVSDCISPSLSNTQTNTHLLSPFLFLCPLSLSALLSLCPPPPAVCLLPGTTVNNETVVLCLG